MARATTTALTFDREHVASLLQHSRGATRRNPTLIQRHYEGMKHAPPGLILVADHGVYLLSNGLGAHGKRGVCAPAYATEANPEKAPFEQWCEAREAVFGGGDGAEFIPADQVQDWLDNSLGAFRLHVTAEAFECEPDPTP